MAMVVGSSIGMLEHVGTCSNPRGIPPEFVGSPIIRITRFHRKRDVANSEIERVS